MDNRLTKHQVATLSKYLESVGDLLEALAMDDATAHMIDGDIEDLHFQLRYVVEEMTKKDDR